MIRILRNCFCWILGWLLILLGFVRKSKNNAFKNNFITPIYFHNPSKKLFAKCIRWLKKNNYLFISTDQLVDIIKRKSKSLVGAVWLSFDDGWKGNIENVIPILEKYNIPATFFIATNPVEDGYFWWTVAEKYRSLLPIKFGDLWTITENERSKIIKNLVNGKIEEIKREAMTIEDIKRISKNNLFTIGSHTVHHAITTNCSDVELEYEISNSKRKLESWTGKEVKYFSYPNGDFDGREEIILKKYGFELAATTENNAVSIYSHLYSMPRYSVMNDGSFAENLCHMLGIWQPFINKIKKILNNSKMKE